MLALGKGGEGICLVNAPLGGDSCDLELDESLERAGRGVVHLVAELDAHGAERLPSGCRPG